MLPDESALNGCVAEGSAKLVPYLATERGGE